MKTHLKSSCSGPKKYSRLISSFILIAFIATHSTGVPVSYAAPATSAIENVKNFPADLSAVQIPGETGKIQEIYKGLGQDVVVLVQDAHAIPGAQRSIQKVIGHFQKQYGLHLVGVEGSASGLDAQIFKSFPDKKLLAKIFEKYFDNGELTGTTAAAIFNEAPAVYHGVENWDLYQDGLGLFLKAAESQVAASEKITALKTALQKQKEAVYSKPLLEIDAALEAFNSHHGDLTGLLKKLSAVKAPEPGTELALLLEELNKENLAQIEVEVKKMAREITAALETARVPNVDSVTFNEKLQQFQTSRVSPETFALTMKEFAAKHGLAVGISGRLKHVIEQQERIKAIEGARFFESFETYAQSVKNHLFKNAAEKKIDQESHRLDVLERLARLEISREDWDEVSSILSGSALNDLFKHHVAFYENAQKRDEIIYENLISLMKQDKASSSLLVAGGFHTEGLIQKLKQNEISYVLVMPQISALPEVNHYREHMRGEVSWSDYFRVENGKLDVYKAFVRATRDLLLEANGEATGMIKNWRDQLLRDLASKEEISKAWQYTPLLDEAIQDKNAQRPQWQIKLNKFVDGLRRLESDGRLSQENIVRLLKPATAADLSANVLGSNSYDLNRIPFPALVKARRAGVKTGPVIISFSKLRSEMRSSKWLVPYGDALKVAAALSADGDFTIRLDKDLEGPFQILFAAFKPLIGGKENFDITIKRDLIEKKQKGQVSNGEIAEIVSVLPKAYAHFTKLPEPAEGVKALWVYGPDYKIVVTPAGISISSDTQVPRISVESLKRASVTLSSSETDLLPETVTVDTLLVELLFSSRSRKAMNKLGLRTVADLTTTPAMDFLVLKNFGERSLTEIREKLRRYGFYLAGEAPDARSEVRSTRASEEKDGLFSATPAVQKLIADIRANWAAILKEGAFVFDVDGTLVPKITDKNLYDQKELMKLLLDLMIAGVEIGIISGHSRPQQTSNVIIPLQTRIKELGLEKSAPEGKHPMDFLTVYVNGGATKLRFKNGEITPDMEYNRVHSIRISEIDLFEEVMRKFAVEEQFGMNAENMAAWREYFAAQYKGIDVDLSWMDKNPDWKPERINADDVIKMKAAKSGKARGPWVEVRDPDGELASNFTLKPLPKDAFEMRGALKVLFEQALGERAKEFGIRLAGTASIDITMIRANKVAAMNNLIASLNRNPKHVYYLGDEFYARQKKDAVKGTYLDEGNDEPLTKVADIVTLAVNHAEPENSRATHWIGRNSEKEHVQAVIEFLTAIDPKTEARSEVRGARLNLEVLEDRSLPASGVMDQMIDQSIGSTGITLNIGSNNPGTSTTAPVVDSTPVSSASSNQNPPVITVTGLEDSYLQGQPVNLNITSKDPDEGDIATTRILSLSYNQVTSNNGNISIQRVEVPANEYSFVNDTFTWVPGDEPTDYPFILRIQANSMGPNGYGGSVPEYAVEINVTPGEPVMPAAPPVLATNQHQPVVTVTGVQESYNPGDTVTLKFTKEDEDPGSVVSLRIDDLTSTIFAGSSSHPIPIRAVVPANQYTLNENDEFTWTIPINTKPNTYTLFAQATSTHPDYGYGGFANHYTTIIVTPGAPAPVVPVAPQEPAAPVATAPAPAANENQPVITVTGLEASYEQGSTVRIKVDGTDADFGTVVTTRVIDVTQTIITGNPSRPLPVRSVVPESQYSFKDGIFTLDTSKITSTDYPLVARFQANSLHPDYGFGGTLPEYAVNIIVTPKTPSAPSVVKENISPNQLNTVRLYDNGQFEVITPRGKFLSPAGIVNAGQVTGAIMVSDQGNVYYVVSQTELYKLKASYTTPERISVSRAVPQGSLVTSLELVERNPVTVEIRTQGQSQPRRVSVDSLEAPPASPAVIPEWAMTIAGMNENLFTVTKTTQDGAHVILIRGSRTGLVDNWFLQVRDAVSREVVAVARYESNTNPTYNNLVNTKIQNGTDIVYDQPGSRLGFTAQGERRGLTVINIPGKTSAPSPQQPAGVVTETTAPGSSKKSGSVITGAGVATSPANIAIIDAIFGGALTFIPRQSVDAFERRAAAMEVILGFRGELPAAPRFNDYHAAEVIMNSDEGVEPFIGDLLDIAAKLGLADAIELEAAVKEYMDILAAAERVSIEYLMTEDELDQFSKLREAADNLKAKSGGKIRVVIYAPESWKNKIKIDANDKIRFYNPAAPDSRGKSRTPADMVASAVKVNGVDTLLTDKIANGDSWPDSKDRAANIVMAMVVRVAAPQMDAARLLTQVGDQPQYRIQSARALDLMHAVTETLAKQFRSEQRIQQAA